MFNFRILFVLIQFIPLCSLASIKWYNPKNGLPERVICSVSFDQQGTCWIGGQSDIYLFNGKNFISYRYFLEDTVKVTGSNYHVMATGQNGFRVLVANSHELFSLEPSDKIKGKFKLTRILKLDSIPLTDFFISNDSTLYAWNNRVIYVWGNQEFKPKSYRLSYGYDVIKTMSGLAFYYTPQAIFQLKKGRPILIKKIDSENPIRINRSLAGYTVCEITVGKDTVFYSIHTFEKIIETIGKKLKAMDSVLGPNNSDFRACYHSKDGSLWFSTIQGLIVYRPNQKEIEGYSIKKSTRGIIVDPKTKKVAFVYYNGIALFDSLGKVLKNEQFVNIFYREACQYGRNAFFLAEGEFKKGLWLNFDHNEIGIISLPLGNHPLGIKVMTQSSVWMAGDSLTQIHFKKFPVLDRVQSRWLGIPLLNKVGFSSKGETLLASQNGLFYVKNFTSSPQKISSENFKTLIWVGSTWMAITIDGKAILGKGPFASEHFHLNKDRKFNQAYELINHPSTGSLWLATDKGVFLLSKDYKRVVLKLSEEDGLYSNELNTFSSFVNEQKIFIGGLNGVNYFNPKEFIKQPAIQLCFYEVITNGQNPDFYYISNQNQGLSLEPNQNNIRIFLKDFSQGKTFIEVFENEKSLIGQSGGFDNQVDLYGLAHGRHALNFRQSGYSKVEQIPVVLLEVQYPWYLRWPFLSGLTLSIAFIFIIIYKVREKVLHGRFLESIESNREQMYQMIAHDLRSPMNSYTNLLGTIDFLIQNNRFEDIRKISSQLQGTARSVDLILKNLLNLVQPKKQQEPKLAPVSLASLMEDFRDIYEVLAQHKDIGFNLYYTDDVILFLDKVELHLCLQNLIDNAIKFAHEQVKVYAYYVASKQTLIFHVCNDFLPFHSNELNQMVQKLKGKKEVVPGEFGKSLGLVIISRSANRLRAFIRPKVKVNSQLDIRINIQCKMIEGEH